MFLSAVINASKRGKSLIFGFSAKQTKLLSLTNGRITSTYTESRAQSLTMFQKMSTALKPYVGIPARHAHTDLKWPDFSKYRRQLTKEPHLQVLEGSYARKVLTYLPVAVALTASLYGTKVVATQLIMSMAPSADVLAMAQAEVKLSSVAVGQMITVKWRGKPLFVKRRAPADVETERRTPLSALRDPERDEDRVIKAEWLVVIGVCTHLGCVPISNAGDYNAFYCPCHGSHYDHSGRIRKGPAPTNLEVPKYVFLNDETLLVG